MITTDELKVQLAEYHTAVKDLEEALAIDASRKRVQELEHTMSRPGFYDDAELSKKVFDEVGDLKGKLTRFEKLQGLYDDAETMLVMLDEEYDPEMVPEAEEAVNAVGKAVDELQLMTMLNGEYDHSNAILTFHAGTGGTEAQDWAEMLYRMYNKWAQAHGMTVEVLDYQDGDEAGMKSASMMVKGANAYGLLKSENGVHRLVRVSPFDANARRQTSFASLEVMPELDNTIQVDIRPEDIEMQVYRSSGAGGQHINKTSSAVRLIHKPTGIVVSCQTQRSCGLPGEKFERSEHDEKSRRFCPRLRGKVHPGSGLYGAVPGVRFPGIHALYYEDAPGLDHRGGAVLLSVAGHAGRVLLPAAQRPRHLHPGL